MTGGTTGTSKLLFAEVTKVSSLSMTNITWTSSRHYK
jgi:hypothetical protein